MGQVKIQVVAGRNEVVSAAIRNGADEIVFSPRFPAEQLAAAVRYCRARGVLTILDLSGRHTDRDLLLASERLTLAGGLSAVRFSDLGVMKMCKMTAPWVNFHYSRDVHSLYDARHAQGLGCARVSLSPHLDMEQAGLLAGKLRTESEMLVLGPVCIASQAQPCFLGDANNSSPGECRHICQNRFSFGAKADETPLFFKDFCLLSQGKALSELGINVFRVVLTLDTPEEAALLTQITKSALEGTPPSGAELTMLSQAFQGPGYTSAPHTEESGPHAVPHASSPGSDRLLEAARAGLSQKAERQSVPVRFLAQIFANRQAQLAVADFDGNTAVVSGPVPVPASDEQLIEAEVNTQWYKTSGTYFKCEDAKTQLDAGLSLPLSVLQDMRREALKKLEAERIRPDGFKTGLFRTGVRYLPRHELPLFNMQLLSFRQLTVELIRFRPHIMYLPIDEFENNRAKVSQLLEEGIIPVGVLPKVITDDMFDEVNGSLEKAKAAGVEQILVYHPSHQALAVKHGMEARAEFFTCNSQELKALHHLGFLSAGLSPSLSLAEIKNMSHRLDTELMTYGRLPVLYSQRCLLKPSNGVCCCDNSNWLLDEAGNRMPVLREGRHGNILYHPQKLWMLPEQKLFNRIGLWAVKLIFTTENARECVQIAEAHISRGKYTPNTVTKGFFLPPEGRRPEGKNKN